MNLRHTESLNTLKGIRVFLLRAVFLKLILRAVKNPLDHLNK